MSDPLKRLADCAPGRRFVVELPVKREAEPALPAMTDAAVAELVRAVGALVESQKRVTDALTEVAKTMGSPVKPIYDARGKLIGAERVKKL